MSSTPHIRGRKPGNGSRIGQGSHAGRAELRRYRQAPGSRRTRPGRAVQGGQRVKVGVGQRVSDADVTMARFAYLGVIFLGPVIPLGVYLLGGRRSPFLRYHTVTALNLSLTGLLYALCCLIVGGLLMLGSLTAALVITLPIALALWLAMLRYLIRGAAAANHGEQGTMPDWICARIAR